MGPSPSQLWAELWIVPWSQMSCAVAEFPFSSVHEPPRVEAALMEDKRKIRE